MLPVPPAARMKQPAAGALSLIRYVFAQATFGANYELL